MCSKNLYAIANQKNGIGPLFGCHEQPRHRSEQSKRDFFRRYTVVICLLFFDGFKNRPVDVPRLLHHALRAAGAIGGVAVEGDGGLGASESIKIRIPLLEGLNEISVHLQLNTQLTIYFLECL